MRMVVLEDGTSGGLNEAEWWGSSVLDDGTSGGLSEAEWWGSSQDVSFMNFIGRLCCGRDELDVVSCSKCSVPQ